MEGLNTSETLEEGSVMLKLGPPQNPCDKTLDEVSRSSQLFDCSVKCTHSVSASAVSLRKNGGGIDVNCTGSELGNVEVGYQDYDTENKIDGVVGTRTYANGNHGFSVCGVETESCVYEGSDEGKRLALSCAGRIKNGDVSALEVGLLVSRNNEFGAVKVAMERGDKEGGSSQLHGVNSTRKIEVSRDGLSLFVDVFGPLNGTLQGDEVKYFGEHVLRESKSDQENLCQGNGELPTANGENANANVFENCGCTVDVTSNGTIDTDVKVDEVHTEATESQQYKFFVGDLVWVKTKVQSWWPGLICDPLNTSRDAANSDKRDFLLVKYFGNANFIWCSPSQLKPFLEYFEQMSRQGSSRSFHGAVERAVGEFGWRIKMEMTCSCVPKESLSSHAKLAGGRRKVESVSKGKVGEVVEFLLNRFEPEYFLTFIKNLAMVVAMPSMIELTVLQGRMSAFGRCIGHLQLPMHLLRPTSDSKDSVQSVLTSEKKNEDLNKLSGEDTDIVLQKPGSVATEERIVSSDSASNSKMPDRHGCNETEDIDCQSLAPSGAEMGTPLFYPETLETVRCGYGNTRKKSVKGCWLRERRRSKYLSHPYVNLSKGHESSPVSGEQGTENLMTISHEGMDINKPAEQTVDSVPVVKCSGKKSQKKWSATQSTGHKISSKAETTNLSSAEILSELRCTALDCLYPNESRYFDSVESSLSEFRKIVFHDEFSHGMVSGSTVDQKEPNHEIHLLPSVEVQMEKGVETEKETPGRERIRVTSGTSDTNKIANYTGSAVKAWQAVSSALSHVVPKWRGRKNKESTFVGSKTNPTACLLDVNENPSGSGPMIINFEMGTVAPKGEAVMKKRKKKAILNLEFRQTKSVPGLPDLNGDGSGLLVEEMQDTSSVAPQGKPVPRNRNRNNGAASEGLQSVAGLLEVNGDEIDFGSHWNNVQMMGIYPVQKIPELNDREGVDKAVSLCLNSPCMSRQPNANGNTVNSSMLMRGSLHLGQLYSGGKCQRRRRTRKEQASDSIAPAIPDLNGNATECNSVGKDLPNMNSSKGKRQRKRKRRHESTTGIPHVNLNYDKVQTNEGSLGIALLLTFAPEYPLPSKEALVATFCSFGPLKVSETNILNDGNAQVVFVRSSDAGNALRSLEQSNPFGPGLISYRLHLLAASKMHSFQPLDGFRTPTKALGLKPNPSEAPDLLYIRQNLEMMTSMLEKAGDNLSPEMRAKLESEIRGLLTKVSTMVGSSSSQIQV